MTEFLSHPVPAVTILLGVLVFVHELGHYLVGRWSGIAVETFSIGFGPRILGWTSRGTEYRLSWIPLGGYVKFAGAHPAEEVPKGLQGIAFRDASLLKRAATIVAGPLANFLLAITVYTTLGMAGIQHPPPLIGEVIEGSAAEAAGIRYGDRFIQINDRKIVTWRDLEDIISHSPGKPLNLTLVRDGAEKTLTLTPAEVEVPDFNGKTLKIGRAGVALGRMPPIVTVIGKDSPAAAAGLVTGDRVQELTAAAKTVPVQSFTELTELLVKASQDHSIATVALKVVSAPLPGADTDKAGAAPSARTLVLDLRAIQGVPLGRNALKPLGLEDSQLTVALAQETLAPVLMKGDVLIAWNGTRVKDVYALRESLIANTSPTVKLKLIRGNEEIEVDAPLKGIEAQRPEGAVTLYTLPVMFWGQPEEPAPVIEKYEGLGAGLAYGINETIKQTGTLVDNVTSLFTGEIPLKALGGPMLIAKVAGDSARRGWQTFVGSMALISINLGLLNLFPIPVLDGGQLVLMGAEAVRRRPLREAAIENFQKVGFAMILALVVLATYNDLSRFWKAMLGSVVGIFQ